jgi:Fe-S-cluster containining protein
MAEGSVFYQCQRCTACCKWAGDVCVEEEEITKISAYLGLEEHEFVQDYTRIRADRTGLSLIDKEGSTECIMLEGMNCRIQSVKPDQCRGFPNVWNFPGWREVCQAIEVPIKGEA